MRRITFVALCFVLSAGWSMLAHGQLVANGGFETENLDNDSPPMPIPPPPGWTITGDGIGVDSDFPNSGLYDVAFGTFTTDSDPGSLIQTITTGPGTYILSFALQDEAGLAEDLFFVTFGGADVAKIKGTDVGTFVYVTQSFQVDVSKANPILSFKGLNDSADWNLDDVSLTPVVTAIPEPSSVVLFGSVLVLSLGMRNLSRQRFRL
jgi:hypothetical protein